MNVGLEMADVFLLWETVTIHSPKNDAALIKNEETLNDDWYLADLIDDEMEIV